MRVKSLFSVGAIFVVGAIFAVIQDHGSTTISKSVFSSQEFCHEDSINGFARFELINRSPGLHAAAIYTAYNNTFGAENYRISMGIGSTNFDLDHNACVLAAITPGALYFDHYFNQSYIFRVNPTNSGTIVGIEEKMVIDTSGVYGDGNQYLGALGEVKMFALSLSNAVTKEKLQVHGWAICDGTTPLSQGITSPTITTTPNLENKFIRGSDDESSGTTGGLDENTFSWTSHDVDDNGTNVVGAVEGSSSGTWTQDNKPPYYELVYFIKVR